MVEMMEKLKRWRIRINLSKREKREAIFNLLFNNKKNINNTIKSSGASSLNSNNNVVRTA